MKEIKFYFPLNARIFNSSAYGDYDEDNYNDEGTPLFGYALNDYRSEIEELMKTYQIDDGEGMEQYFDESDNAEVASKLKSMVWGFESVNHELYGTVVVTLTDNISAEGVSALKDWITGQNSDGLGEGFEQQDINVGDGYLNVSLWDYNDYYIDTAEEFAARHCIQNMPVTEKPESTQKVKPKVKLVGEDGNIFNLIGIASRALKRNGMADAAKEMTDRITGGEAQNYHQALGIILEYVDESGGSGEDVSEDFTQSM